jgi:hypothetical protein
LRVVEDLDGYRVVGLPLDLILETLRLPPKTGWEIGNCRLALSLIGSAQAAPAGNRRDSSRQATPRPIVHPKRLVLHKSDTRLAHAIPGGKVVAFAA